MIDLDDVLPPLDRLLALAARDTGQSRHAADFLLAWWNAASCGGFDLTTLWAIDRPVAADMLAVLQLIALRHEYPTAYGRGPAFEALAAGPGPGRPVMNGHDAALPTASSGLEDEVRLSAMPDGDRQDDTQRREPLPFLVEELTSMNILPARAVIAAPPLGGPPARVRSWFDDAAAAQIPDHDGTIGTARLAAQAYARHAKADNTRRAYRAGVRAWCAWCDQHALPCLPARSDDVVAFLAAERGRGLSVNTIDLRRAAIRYLHFIAGCAVPTAEAHVAETMAGIHREAADRGDVPAKKLAATADILRDILAPILDDLPGLRDRALLLVGFAGALRRSELAAICVEHLEQRERGLRLTLPRSKGERAGKAVTVAIPYGTTMLCPVRALRRWQEAAGITEGALFRRIWRPPTRAGGQGPLPSPVIGVDAVDPGTIARIVKKRAAAAGFDRRDLGGHSLKRGAMTTGMDRGVHPTRLKQLGRHKSYAVLDEYLESGDPFEGHPLAGVL